MMLISAMLAHPSLISFKKALVKQSVALVSKSASFGPEEVVAVIPALLASLGEMAEKAPPVLGVFLQSLASVKRAVAMKNSVFFLRFVCPALSQPLRVSGHLPDDTLSRLLLLSKALQSCANKVAPPEHSPLFCVASSIYSLQQLLDDVVNKLISCSVCVVDVPESMLRPAAQLYSALCGLGLTDAEFDMIRVELGPPLRPDCSDKDLTPKIAKVKSLLSDLMVADV